MARNNTNTHIFIDTSTTPNKGVEIADLQAVLRSSKNDIGGIITTAYINKMAKYKPVRHSKIGLLTVEELASTRYGFGSGIIPSLNLTQASPKNDWVYYPPRGMANNECFRLRDFEGYSHGACTPLALKVGQLVYDGESQILIFGDGYSNAIREDGKRWEPDESLSIMELLHSGGTSYDGNYIAFLLVDKTNTSNKNLIVTNKTVSNVVNNGSYYIFQLYAQGNGNNNPAIPILSQGNSGHTFEVIVCLMAGNFPTTGNYAVYTSLTSPSVTSLTPYSLGFESGCDRTEAVLDTGAFMMDGTTITGWNVIVTDMSTEETISGQVFRAYSLEIRATFSTMGAGAYSGRTMTISGMMDFNTSGSFGPTLNDSGSLSAQGVAVSLESKTAGQDKILWSSGGVNYMWIPKVNGSVVRTSLDLSVDFDYPFSAGHHATDTYTAYIPN